MGERLEVLKTYKLSIDGAFPRSESGRTTPVHGSPARQGQDAPVLAHVAKASRKDLRDAVESARKAQPKWSDATAYLRGQILYRMAEMLEGKRDEFIGALSSVPSMARMPSRTSAPSANAKRSRARSTAKPASKSPRPPSPKDEVSLAIDRLVNFAGWSDKFSQILGCHNPVSGPFYNFTIAEATGVVGVVAPDECPLLALISLLAPPICAGNAVVALGSETNPIVPAILGEVLATSDVPAGVVNILTGERAELIPHFASHRDIDAIHAANLPIASMTPLRAGMAENLKRVSIRDNVDWANAALCQTPFWIEAFVEFKTIWHPSAV